MQTENKHPWIKLALAEAYHANNQMDKTIELLGTMNELYSGYLPVTIAYAKALNSIKQPEKSIELLLRQLQTDENAIIYQTLAKSYYLNGQVSAALEATGNQYVMQGYNELALQQYQNALVQDDLSSTSKARLEAKKNQLLEAVKAQYR